jgi:hypothetical protein
MKTAVEKLIAKYNKQWNKYGMGSVIAYSQVVADLEKLKEMEKEQREQDFINGYKARAELSGLIFDEASELTAKELFKQNNNESK